MPLTLPQHSPVEHSSSSDDQKVKKERKMRSSTFDSNKPREPYFELVVKVRR